MIKNILGTLSRQVGTGVLQLVTIILISRTYGPEVSGAYTVALLLPTILATFLNFGIGIANVYYLGSSQITPLNAWKTTMKLYKRIVFSGLILGGYLVIYHSDTFFSGVSNIQLWIALASFPSSLLLSFIITHFQGLQKFKELNLALILQSVVSLFIVVIIILFQRDSVSYLLVAYLTGNIVAMLVSYKKLQIYLVDDLADELNVERKEDYTKKSLKYGLKSHLSNILAFVNYRADILIVNGIAGPAAAGVYIVSIQLTEKIWLLSQSVGTVLLPKLSELSGDDNKKKKLTPQVSRWVLFITFFLATLLGSVSYVLIEFLFGDKFMGAVSALLILLPGTVLASSSRVLANDVASRGKPELNMYSSIFVVVTNISLNLILIPDFGIQGAALATTLAYSLNFILRLFIYRYLTGAVFTDVIFLKKSDVKMFVSLIKGTR